MSKEPDRAEPFKASGAPNELFPQLRFLDSRIFLTKLDAVGMMFEAAGFDAETLTAERVKKNFAKVQAAFRNMDESYRIYQYVVKVDGAKIPTSVYPNETVAETAERRARHLQAKNLSTVRLFYCVLVEPDKPPKKALFSGGMMRFLLHNLYRRCGVLSARATTLGEQLGRLIGLRAMTRDEAFRFFRFLASLDEEIADVIPFNPSGKRSLDEQIPSVRIKQLYEDERVYGGFSLKSGFADRIRVGDQDVEILTMTDWPRTAPPNVLGGLVGLECNFILCSEFKRMPHEKAYRLIRRRQRNAWMSKDNADMDSFAKGSIEDRSALVEVDWFDQALARLKSGEHAGEYSFTAALFGSQYAELKRDSAKVSKVLGEIEAPVMRETYGALCAYLAVQPGNTPFNFRRNLLLSNDYANMSFVCIPDQGAALVDGREYALVLETNDRTPHYLQVYAGDRHGDLVIGAPGSGKSFLINALIDGVQKYDPWTFILDIGGSYRKLARKHGGAYFDMEAVVNGGCAFNPFSLAPTEENFNFIASLFAILRGGEFDAIRREALFQQVKAHYRVEPRSRTLGRFVRSLPFEEEMYYRPWVRGGQFGSVFDNAEDTLELSRFQVFDFQGLKHNYKPLIAPLFHYITQRILQIVYDPAVLASPKFLWADEIWNFVSNDQQQSRGLLLSAGLEWRKHGGGIGLATQSTVSLREAGVMEIINELCPVKILMPNPDADMSEHARIFHLNEREIEVFPTLLEKRQCMVKTARGSKVLNYDPEPEAYAEYANEISLLKGEMEKDEMELSRRNGSSLVHGSRR